MSYYMESRHMPIWIWVVLVLVVLIVLVFPTKAKQVTVVENITVLETRVVEQPIERLQQVTLNVSTTVQREENRSVNYSVRKDNKLRQVNIKGVVFAIQDFSYVTPEPVVGCYPFHYYFMLDEHRVNQDGGVVCFEHNVASVSLQEPFVGDLEDYNYVTFLNESPKIFESFEDEVLVPVTQEQMVSVMENVTEYINVTKSIPKNKTIRVHWLLGIELF